MLAGQEAKEVLQGSYRMGHHNWLILWVVCTNLIPEGAGLHWSAAGTWEHAETTHAWQR